MTDEGAAMRARYQEKFNAGVTKWLRASPSAPEFPVLSIKLHTELSAYQELIRDLDPELAERNGESDA
jgi:hypothetical protein